MGLYDITLQDVIERNALLHTNKIAMVCEGGTLTFGDYRKQAKRLAAGLASMGVEKGDRIGVIAFNCHQFLLLYGAAAYLGAIVVPVNWRLKPDEMYVILEDSAPKAVVAGPEYVNLMKELADRLPFIRYQFVMGEGVFTFPSMKEIEKSVEGFQGLELTQQDPFVLIYTAAVGGKPKGAVLTHGNLIASNFQAMALMGIHKGDVYLNLVPFFHIGGLAMAFQVMHAGGQNVIVKKFESHEAIVSIREHQVTVIETFPPMLSTLIEQATASERSLSSLRVAFGIDVPETIQRFQKMTGAEYWVCYGQTETTGACTLSRFDECPGSAGREGVSARVRVVDDYDREVPSGQAGEIVVRGPLVFQKYWNQEEETSYAFREGWHHTGDIGRLDEKGYLWYLRRKPEKELIKPGGENVYPAEVEKAILEHSEVSEACVFGVPDRQWGEAIKAVCVRNLGSSLEPQDLIEFVASRIARYKKPKFVTFVASLPKTEDGRVDREKVKAEHGQDV